MQKANYTGRSYLLMWVMIAVWAFAMPAQAQNPSAGGGGRKISGTVTVQGTGRPIPGAAIIVKGTKQAVATDENGNFTIQAEPGQIIRVTSLGF